VSAEFHYFAELRSTRRKMARQVDARRVVDKVAECERSSTPPFAKLNDHDGCVSYPALPCSDASNLFTQAFWHFF